MTFHTILVIFELLTAVAIFITLFFIKAPYGKFFNNESKWGKAISPKLGWIIMEIPSVIIPFIFAFFTNNKIYNIFLIIWEFHYIQRTFIHPFSMKTNKQMPILIPISGSIFNIINSYVVFYYLANTKYNYAWLSSDPFIFGLLIFILGCYINLKADNILRNLRKEATEDYKIPRGWLYEYIIAPNYLGEILEWIGFAILTLSFSSFVFVLFTIANMFPRAYHSRLWYIDTFKEDFLKNRKILIPFIL